MTNMKIENWSGTADTFTFPYNPKSVDDTIQTNHSVTNIAYQRHHILISGGGYKPISIVMTGHFSGTDRWTNFRSLSEHFGESIRLKKLYFESDKFRLGIGTNLKKTHSGGRTNFIDYVFSFTAVVGLLMGDTEKTSGTNDGNTRTFITEVSGDVSDGTSDVTITDEYGTVLTIPASSLTTGDTINYKLVEMVDSGSGVYVSEYGYVTINGTQTNNAQINNGFLLELGSGSDISTLSTTNLSSVVKKFRDGYTD